MKTLYFLILVLILLLPRLQVSALERSSPPLLGQFQTQEIVVGQCLENLASPSYDQVSTFVVREILKGLLQVGTKVQTHCSPQAGGICPCEPQKDYYLFLDPLKGGGPADFIVAIEPGILPLSTTANKEEVKRLISGDRLMILEVAQKSAHGYLVASACLLLAKNPADTATSECLMRLYSLDSLDSQVEALLSSGPKLRKQGQTDLSICNGVKSNFSSNHPVRLVAAEIAFLSQTCPKQDFAGFCLGHLASQNDYVRMNCVNQLAFTDGASVKKAVAFFEQNPKMLSSEIINQLSFALYSVGECGLLDEYVKKAAVHNLPPDTSDDSFNPIEIAEISLLKCRASDPAAKPDLLNLLSGGGGDSKIFPIKRASRSFRVLNEAVHALEKQLKKGQIAPNDADLCSTMGTVLDTGHPQVVAEVIDLFLRSSPCPDAENLVLKAALKPGAKKWHQSRAILGLLRKGKRDLACQISQSSRYAGIKRICELLPKTSS